MLAPRALALCDTPCTLEGLTHGAHFRHETCYQQACRHLAHNLGKACVPDGERCVSSLAFLALHLYTLSERKPLTTVNELDAVEQRRQEQLGGGIRGEAGGLLVKPRRSRAMELHPQTVDAARTLLQGALSAKNSEEALKICEDFEMEVRSLAQPCLHTMGKRVPK